VKIIKIEPFILEQKLDQTFHFSQWQYDSRKICVVRVTTDEGLYGWGEGYGPAEILESGIKFFTPFLLDKDPLHVETLWRSMYLNSLDFARRGIMLSALSALDVALWDINGKILNQPISVLLGGRFRESVPVYASGMYFCNGNQLHTQFAEEAEKYRNLGLSAVKMKVGLGVETDAEHVSIVREALGKDMKLMVDANHAFNLNEAIKLADKIEQYDINWFEEPLSPEDYSGYYELRNSINLPIAGGECEYLRYGFRYLFENRCVDIAQPDICAAGGFTEVKKVIAMAETYGIEVIPHCWGTGIAISATLQMLANISIVPGRLYEPEPFLELDYSENAIRETLIIPKFEVKKGRMDIPDKPGLGIDVDLDVLDRFRI